MILQYQTERIEGQDLVEGIVIKSQKSGEEKHLDVTGVFIEIGWCPTQAQ